MNRKIDKIEQNDFGLLVESKAREKEGEMMGNEETHFPVNYSVGCYYHFIVAKQLGFTSHFISVSLIRLTTHNAVTRA